jgi:threonine/homoserine/homoserine lactone efflux protein
VNRKAVLGVTLKGFRFGMLLQLAIGPVCIFIFQLASTKGFMQGAAGVLGVVLIDGLFIMAAIFGMASLIEKKNIKTVLRFIGAAILFLFGISTILGQFGIVLIPSISASGVSSANSAFLNAILLTASNPLTIIFWAGVFSAEITDANMKKSEMYSFGAGALLSTLLFLTLVAAAGALIKNFLSDDIIMSLNIFVGFLLIFFSIRMVIKRV